MTRLRFSVIVIAFCFAALFLNIPFSVGQVDVPIPVTPEAESDSAPYAGDPLKISVNVKEVRLDVVVVDNKGRPITDLTADDFEVYQDKLSQDVTSSVYINDQTAAAASPAASQRNTPNLPPLSVPGTELKKEEDVRRTIVFVVDNLSMSAMEDMHYAKMALKRFVERQMQPGDLVSIMCTSYGNGILDMFTSDKRQLNARIDGLHVELAMPDRIYGSQEIALSYAVRALKDMPGRKIIFLVTPEPTIDDPFDNFTTPTADGGSELTRNSDRPLINYFQLYGARFNRLADEAMRAGVVVHLLDVTGLCVPFENPMCEVRLKKMAENPWNPLPAKTGGIIITNENYFLDGIGDYANNMIAGYYLVSYIPPPGTFDRADYRRVSINVKRKGAVVHTREGFYSRTENEADSAAPAVHPLQNAILSPFQHADLNVSMAAGYIKGPKDDYVLKGPAARAIKYPDYFIRSWIHLDAKNLKMIETEEGARVELEAVCMTSGINVAVNDYDIRHVKYTFNIKPENIAWVREHGLRFSLLLPVKKPGAYTVRVAVQDTESGKTGTAHQFLEIPDLKKSGMELSSVFMITSADGLIWMRSDVMKEINELTFLPVLAKDESRNPALRSYAPGDTLQTLAMLYNADKKAIDRSEIEVQSILYKDGVEFRRSTPNSITPNTVDNYDGISLFQRLSMGANIPPGNYTLQLLVTDKKNSEKRDEEGGVFAEKQGLFSKIARAYLGTEKNYNRKGVAFQTLNFTIAKE